MAEKKKLELRPYQREDVKLIKKAGLRVLIASAPGTGKTAIALRCIYEKHTSALPAMVLCPASVTENWALEAGKWAPGIRVVIIDDLESRIPRFRKPHTLYIMSWSLLAERLPELRRLRLRTVIGDEIHYVKNPETQRSKAFSDLTASLPHLLLLSGTPVVNTRGELDVIKRILGEDPLMIRHLLEDVAPDVPPKKRSYLNIRLRDKHQVNYDKANEEFEQWLLKEKEKLMGKGLAAFEVERVLAAEALVKVGYLRRLVGEYKVPAAVDWISRAVRIGEPVVVFFEHQATMKRLRHALKKLRLRHVVVQGSTSPKARQKAIEAFQKGKVPIFIGTKAAKEGITLHRARHLLFIERFFTSADEEQAEDRIRRIGQKYKTTIWLLHAVGTIDDRLDDIIRTKRRVVHRAIGSADIQDTDEKSVEAIIHTWNNAVSTHGDISDLGRGRPLAALPKPRHTHAILFSGDRWDTARAKVWCRMNGYAPRKLKKFKGRFKYIQQPIDLFLPNRFETFNVCSDVKIITGQRLSRGNERQVRRHLSTIYG
jgi:SNF2 family DNA or RNA helicase